jgi:hypothetical protein
METAIVIAGWSRVRVDRGVVHASDVRPMRHRTHIAKCDCGGSVKLMLATKVELVSIGILNVGS